MIVNSLDLKSCAGCVDWVHDFCGFQFDDSNWMGLKVALLERMECLGISDPREYTVRLKQNPNEQSALLGLFLVPETYLMRDKHQFKVLRETILPEIVDKKETKLKGLGKPHVRILSCGCSTGEEAYSLAITAHQSGLMDRARFNVTAIDLSKKAIEKARKAAYSLHSFREKGLEGLMDYFDMKGQAYVPKQSIRDLVQFHQGNLFELDRMGLDLNGVDVIFFRNVLIYFSEEKIDWVIKYFEEILSDDGYLFLGSAESLMFRKTGFSLEAFRDASAWRKKGRTPMAQSKPVREFIQKPAPSRNPTPRLSPTKNIPKPKVPRITDNDSHYENGLGYFRIKKMDKAESEFKAQLEKTPRHLATLVNLAHLYADQGRDELAFETCRRAEKVDNLVGDVYFTLGLIHFKRKDFNPALQNFKKTLYCEENHFLARYYVGMSQMALGNKEESEHTLRTCAKLIQAQGEAGLRQDIFGFSASYVLNLCKDNKESG